MLYACRRFLALPSSPPFRTQQLSRRCGLLLQQEQNLSRLQSTTSATTEAIKAKTSLKPPVSSAPKDSLKNEASNQESTSLMSVIGTSLLAAIAGVTTVGMAAAVVESATAQSVPKYSSESGAQRFDQSTFEGRFCKMLLVCDPRLLFYTQAQVEQAKEELQEYDNNKLQRHMDDRSLWETRRIVEGALNRSDDDSWIPRPFRMSGYVPYNGPVCVAMIVSQSTTPLLFWSWVNQSQNALVNYYNRSGGSNLSNEVLTKSYVAAVTAALSVAFGLATFIQKRFEPNQAKQLLRWVAFPSAVVASSLNCYIVRAPEIETGIPLLDDYHRAVVSDGTTSRIAAAEGVYSTTASRAILQIPVYFIPPAILSLPYIRNRVPKRYMVPLTTYLLLVCSGLGLPATIAIFPQIRAIPATNVEERFQQLRDPITEQPYKVFYYNKGL